MNNGKKIDYIFDILPLNENYICGLSEEFKQKILLCIKEDNFSFIIQNIKTFEDLSSFIKFFKSKKQKLDYKFFIEFTDQLLDNIPGDIVFNDKIRIFSDVFGAKFQTNEYNNGGHKFGEFIDKDYEEEGGRFFYIENQLLKRPISFDEKLILKYNFPNYIFR